MSTLIGLPSPGGGFREVALIRKILERTKQGKVKWQRQPSAISAATANGLQFYFVLTAPFAPLGQDWVTFTVRDQNAEIATVQKNPLPIPIPTVSFPTDPVVSAANELFQAVSGAAEDNVDRAIRKLDNI